MNPGRDELEATVYIHTVSGEVAEHVISRQTSVGDVLSVLTDAHNTPLGRGVVPLSEQYIETELHTVPTTWLLHVRSGDPIHIYLSEINFFVRLVFRPDGPVNRQLTADVQTNGSATVGDLLIEGMLIFGVHPFEAFGLLRQGTPLLYDVRLRDYGIGENSVVGMEDHRRRTRRPLPARVVRRY